MQTLDAKPQSTGKLAVVNSQYGFQLHRRKDSAPWAIDQVDTDLSDGLSFDIPGQPLAKCVGFYLELPVRPNDPDDTLASLLADPSFSIKHVSRASRDGRELIKVIFELSRNVSKTPDILTGGWLLVDPNYCWVLRESQLQYEYRTKTKVTGRGTATALLEYQEGADSFPIVRRVVQKVTFPPSSGEIGETRISYDFDLTEAEVPEREFTLSAFGFSEPPGLPRRPVPWYLWAGLAGICCLALALVFRWRARRQRTTGVGAS
jgi:hypothetical protein